MTNIVTEKAKTIYPLYTSYRGIINSDNLKIFRAKTHVELLSAWLKTTIGHQPTYVSSQGGNNQIKLKAITYRYSEQKHLLSNFLSIQRQTSGNTPMYHHRGNNQIKLKVITYRYSELKHLFSNFGSNQRQASGTNTPKYHHRGSNQIKLKVITYRYSELKHVFSNLR